jgi:hypothetical protein
MIRIEEKKKKIITTERTEVTERKRKGVLSFSLGDLGALGGKISLVSLWSES